MEAKTSNHRTHGHSVASTGPAAPYEVGEGRIWTCPMHPQIRLPIPGNCPICGMALELLEPSLEERPNTELIAMTRRFWVSAALSVPLVVLIISTELAGWEPMSMRQLSWLQLVLATPIVLWGGWPFFERFLALPSRL